MDILDLPYSVIASIDFGHGETVAFKQTKTAAGSWEQQRLRLNYEDTVSIPSYLCYREEGIRIGYNAQNQPDVLQQFKVEPALWGALADGQHTYAQVMEDFIREVWKQARIYDEQIDKMTGTKKLLLVVGCPAGEMWTNQRTTEKFCSLIKKATGCVCVEILPESVGAMLNCLRGNALKKGLAVYDMGSSTIDFTYLTGGRPALSRSLRMAGSDLDRCMLHVLLQRDGYSWEDIPPEQRSRILIQLRQHKENYYRNDKVPGTEVVSIFYRTDKNGNKQRCPLFYRVDSELMEEAMQQVRTIWQDHLATENGGRLQEVYRDKSWLECCEAFFRETSALIGGQVPEVVLTGGTSFVTEILELAQRTYPKSHVTRERDPSVTVAKGLCNAKQEEEAYLSELKYRMEKRKEHVPATAKAMLEEFSVPFYLVMLLHSAFAYGEVFNLNPFGRKKRIERFKASLKERIRGHMAPVARSFLSEVIDKGLPGLYASGTRSWDSDRDTKSIILMFVRSMSGRNTSPQFLSAFNIQQHISPEKIVRFLDDIINKKGEEFYDLVASAAAMLLAFIATPLGILLLSATVAFTSVEDVVQSLNEAMRILLNGMGKILSLHFFGFETLIADVLNAQIEWETLQELEQTYPKRIR